MGCQRNKAELLFSNPRRTCVQNGRPMIIAVLHQSNRQFCFSLWTSSSVVIVQNAQEIKTCGALHRSPATRPPSRQVRVLARTDLDSDWASKTGPYHTRPPSYLGQKVLPFTVPLRILSFGSMSGWRGGSFLGGLDVELSRWTVPAVMNNFSTEREERAH